MLTLHFNNTTLDVQESDSSYRYRSLMSKPQLVLKFSLSEFVEIPVGAWCEYQGVKYKLGSPEDIKKNGTRNIEYTLTLGTLEDNMSLYKMRNPVDKRLKWSICAKPHELVEAIVWNLNQRDGADVWKVGECLDAAEQTVEFNHTYVDAALQDIADKFETEWEINDYTISLHKVEYFKDDPLPLAYGKGNGFEPGIGRTTQSDELPIKRLYVQGGDRNIDRSKYGSAELLLPKSQTLVYEGRTYQSDAEGYSIERIDKVSDAVKEDSLDCSEIYPSREGTVSAVECIDAGKNFYDIIDNSIPAELNFNDYVIEGETATISFQKGMLAGDDKQFEFKYNHSERRFELVPQEIDGVTMPNETFKPAVGDTYAIFGIMLPDAYICNNTDKTGASWDMFREAARKLYENEDPKFTFTGTLQGLWAKKNWLRVGGRLKVGGYVLFTDEQFVPDGIAIRITGIKEYLTSPYAPVLEISNSVSGKSVSSQLREIGQNEVATDNSIRNAVSYTKRRFRDVKETMAMLEDSMLDNFTNSINPLTVQTMMMLVGDESLQFQFVASKTSTTVVNDGITYDNAAKQLHIPHGFIRHMTLGISTISSSHANSEYKVWEMNEYLSPYLDNGEKKYYLYAKVNRTNTSVKGDFLLSDRAIKMTDVAGYYHLLVGVLNSEYDEERSFASLYGFTEIMPGRITTDKVISADGKNFMDFLSNAFRIGNDKTYIDWNAAIANVLSMKNATIQIANSAGQTMIYFSGVDGSGQLAKGNITWDSAGNIKAKGGTFTDVKITGSLRNPFSEADDSFDVDYSDNVVLLSSGGGWITAYSLPWDLGQSGRRICIVNYRWGNTISSGFAAISAPTGKYFYENGISKSELQMSREVIELMGYGDNKTFFGWIVMRRINMMTTSRYGRNLNVLAQGIVSGYSSGASISYKSFDDTTLSVSRLDVGKYRVYVPSAWGLMTDSYIVMMTGYGGGLMKASLLTRSTTYFDVEVSDDASRNDGSFMFQIINLNDWL